MPDKKNAQTNQPGEMPLDTATVAALPLRWVKVTHHTPDHIASRYLYAGYGSNLAMEQMMRRCPGADIHGSGMLRGARLVFAYHLGIVEDEQATTLMGVYKLTAADVAALDRYEALGRLYDRYLVTVEVNGQAVRCFTYVKRNNNPKQPSDKYYATCLQGFNDWNFDARRLRHARDHARKNESKAKPGCGNGHGSGWDWREYYDSKKGTLPANDRTMGNGRDEPEGNGTAASYHPRTSLVTGRQLDRRIPRRHHGDQRNNRLDERTSVAEFKKQVETLRKDAPLIGGKEPETFTNPRTGERWYRGPNGFWIPLAKGDA